jgi:hypothetical protein
LLDPRQPGNAVRIIMKKKQNKLSVARDTIRRLVQVELHQVVAGVNTSGTQNTCTKGCGSLQGSQHQM